MATIKIKSAIGYKKNIHDGVNFPSTVNNAVINKTGICKGYYTVLGRDLIAAGWSIDSYFNESEYLFAPSEIQA